MSLPPNQTVLFKNFWLKMNGVFFVSVQPGIGTWDLSVTDPSSVPNSCQIPHEISHPHLGSRAVSIPRMTDNGSQATSQNTALERWWENFSGTRIGCRGIFSCGQGLYTLCCLRREPEIIPGLGSCHSFQIPISLKTKKFKYKLTWCWDPKPHLGKALFFLLF